MHTAVMVSLFDLGSDGRTAYERSRGKPSQKELPMFGECVCVIRLRWTGTHYQCSQQCAAVREEFSADAKCTSVQAWRIENMWEVVKDATRS